MKLPINLLLLTLLASVDSAQWAPPLPGSGLPVTVEGSLAIHDDGTSYQAFSAASKSWLAAAPSTATLTGAGDWAALFELADGTFTGYSARLQATAAGPAGPALDVRVEDDVIGVLTLDAAGYHLWGYSAETNAWALQTFPDPPSIASSRFVLCAKSTATGEIAGFGARFGYWNVIGLGSCDPPIADGNVGALVHHAPGNDLAVAFSGVTNIWNITPAPVYTGVFPLEIDHDVALVNLSQPGGYQACGYSAYTSDWIASPVLSPEVDVVARVLRDKLIVIQRSAAPHFEAIGAVPHGAWAVLSGPALNLLGTSEDVAVLENPVAGNLLAYSGLVSGAWQVTPYAGGATFEGTPEHAALVRDAVDTFYAFSPLAAAWSIQAIPGGIVHVGDCVAVVRTPGGGAQAWSARHNAWVGAPPLGAGFSILYDAAGSIATREVRDVALGTTTTLTVFDERYGIWGAPFATSGGGFVAKAIGRNAMLVHDSGSRLGYSIQRDDMTPSPAVGPVASWVEEDAIVVRDGMGNLHAFGSPEETHAMYDYPLGTEAQHFSSPVFGGQIVRATVQGPAPGLAWLQFGTAPFVPALVTPFGCLALAGPFLAPPPGAAVGASGLAAFSVPLPGLPGPVRVWSQGATFDLVTLTIHFAGCRAEPIEIF